MLVKEVCIFFLFFFWLDWRQIFMSFHFMCWKGHARLNSSAAVKQPVSWLNVANPVK